MSRANSSRGVARRLVSRFITITSIAAALACLVALAGPAAVAADAAPSVTAPYAVVVDADTGQVLYDKSMNTRTAPASLTKLFTTAVALDSTPLDTKMTVDNTDLVGEASMGLSAGETLSLKDLLYGMLLPSGNDAAMTVAENIGRRPGDTPQQAVARFVKMMNQTAQRLGLTGSTFKNPHGLDQPGHQTTARDVAAITMYLLKQPEFHTIIGTNMYNAGGHDLITANRLLGEYPGLIGGKTGITDNAGYSLMEAAQRGGHTVIAVVMKDTDTAWYDDASSLLDYGFSVLASGTVNPALPKITLAQAAPHVTAVTDAAAPVNAKYKVDRIAAGTAVVSASSGSPSSAALSWGWLLAAIVAIFLSLLAVFHREALLDYARNTRLTWGRIRERQHARQERSVSARRQRNSEALRLSATERSRRRRAALQPVDAVAHWEPLRRRSRRSMSDLQSGTEQFVASASGVRSHPRLTPPTARTPAAAFTAPRLHGFEDEEGSQPLFMEPTPFNASLALAARAIRLANRGAYSESTQVFKQALEGDADCDLTGANGFWSMQPLGYVAAARAYLLLDRPNDARALSTVVELALGGGPEFERLLRQAAREAAVAAV